MSIDNENAVLNAVQYFFDSNMQIKKMMMDIAPESYSIVRHGYADRVFEFLKDAQFRFDRFTKELGFPQDTIDLLHAKLDKIKAHFYECESGDKDFQTFYRDYISKIEPELVMFLDDKYFGHKLDKPPVTDALSKADTINGLLHVFHHVVINSEQICEKLPFIASRPAKNEQRIVLRGKVVSDSLACEIFAKMPWDNIDCDETSIIGLSNPNSAFMMLRGVGHATTIKIEQDDGKYYVNYFIPKVCNVSLARKLDGANGIHEGSNNLPFMTGVFACNDRAELCDRLGRFIQAVPRDKDAEIIRS